LLQFLEHYLFAFTIFI